MYKSLHFQVIVAIIIGIAFGHFFPCAGVSMEDMKKVGRVGGKAQLYFEAVTTIALIMGLVVINLTKPGMDEY